MNWRTADIRSICPRSSRNILNVVAFLGAMFLPVASLAFEASAKQAVLIDFDTGVELYSKNADELMPPASMTKMMTVYLLFERLKEGRLALDDELLVSRKAWRKGGSKMFVEAGKRARVEDLIRGIVVQSGNDATIVVAEGLAGSEEAFAREMTVKARDLGMSNTTFRNASGWPDPEHRTSARDLAILADEQLQRSRFPTVCYGSVDFRKRKFYGFDCVAIGFFCLGFTHADLANFRVYICHRGQLLRHGLGWKFHQRGLLGRAAHSD